MLKKVSTKQNKSSYAENRRVLGGVMMDDYAKQSKKGIISLHYGYFIEVDKMCYTLKRVRKGQNKKGDEIDTETTFGYFGSIMNAMDKYLEYAHIDKMPDKAIEMREYVEIIEQSNKNALRGLQSVLDRFPIK